MTPRSFIFLCVLRVLCGPPSAVSAEEVPPIGFDQRLGDQLPLDAVLLDEGGRPVRLGELLADRPAILALGYYRCPMLCTLVFNGLARALSLVPFDAGRQFRVVAVSIDPTEGSALAAERKRGLLRLYGRADAADGWRLLTGRAEQVERLARAAGFRYAFDPASRQYRHSAGIVVASPGGKVSRYLFGVEFAPKDLRLALAEASAGRVGSALDQVLLFCYGYDPARGRYSLAALKVLRLASALTLAGMGALALTLSKWRAA